VGKRRNEKHNITHGGVKITTGGAEIKTENGMKMLKRRKQ